MESLPKMQAVVDRLHAEGVIDYPIEVRYFGPIGSGNVEIQLLRDGDVADRVGHFFTSKHADGWESPNTLRGISDPCLKAYRKVRRKNKGAGLWSVQWAFLKDKALWGHGLGKMAYEQILQDAGKFGAVVFPAWCAKGGSTTPMAQRVWDSVGKRHGTEGVVVIPKNLRVASAVGVADRYANRTLTQQQQRLEKAIEAFMGALRETGSAFGWRQKPIPPGTPAAMRAAASALYDLLDLQFEKEFDAARLKKYLRRTKNLRKMVSQYRRVADVEELKAVYQAQSSKSKDAWEKIRDYIRDVVAILTTFDSEPLGGFRVGGMRVSVIQQGGKAWDSEMIEKLKAVLAKTEAFLKGRGLGVLTKNLLVFAYPTAAIPGTGSANAYYNRVKDIAAIAAGSDWFSNSTVDRMVQTMVHELGHRAYYQIIGNTGRGAWEGFFEAMQSPPDVDGMIRRWKAWVQQAKDSKEQRRRSHFGMWFPELSGKDAEAAQWLLMAVRSLGLQKGEKFDSYYGNPTPTSVAALDVLEDRKDEVKVFAEPVTAYSATNPSELFAEVFAHYIAHGPRTLSPRVRAEFKRTLPQMKVGRTHRFSYQGGHKPPNDGAQAHDMGSGIHFPADILTHPEWYTGFSGHLRSFWDSILKAQGKPGSRISVYRALPGQHTTFSKGDWVTPSLRYAQDHAAGEDGWHIIKATVPARTLRFAGDDLVEWGYWGPTVEGKVVGHARAAKRNSHPMKVGRAPAPLLDLDARRLKYFQHSIKFWGESLKRAGYGDLAAQAAQLVRAISQLEGSVDPTALVQEIESLVDSIREGMGVRSALNALDRVVEDVNDEIIRPFRRRAAIRAASRFVDEGMVGEHWGSTASGVLVTDGSRVLLLKRSPHVEDPGLWGIPGGAVPVDHGSGRPMDAKKSAFIEAKEEMGGIPSGSGAGKHVFRGSGDFTFTTFVWEVDPETLDQFTPRLNWEHTDWKVEDIGAVGSGIHPGVLWVLKKMGPGRVAASFAHGRL